MSKIIHMQTERTQSVAQQMVRTVEAVYEQTQNLANAIHRLDWQSPARDSWENDALRLVHTLSQLSESGSLLGMRVQREVDEWLLADSNGADGFSAAGAAFLASLPAAGMMVEFASMPAGQVLGASTSIADYQDMPWSQKFKEQATLSTAISELENSLQNELPQNINDVDSEINELDRLIAETENSKAEAQEGADSLLNKIVPDSPFDWDDDGGIPWRTVSDDYEDIVDGDDKSLQDLADRRTALLQQKETLISLEQIKEQRATLNQIVADGVATDGPTPDWLKNQLGGCTHYVAEKRNVQPWPNNAGAAGHPGDAFNWNDQAQSAGYDVGKYPAKGAIMVFEPGIEGSHASAGHVAYVESVIQTDSGYQVKISEANTMYENGAFVRGVHTTPTTRTIPIPSGGLDGTSFIYEELPAPNVEQA